MEQEEITEGQSAEDRTAAVEALHSSSTLKSRTNQIDSLWSPNGLEGEKFKYKSEFFLLNTTFFFCRFFYFFAVNSNHANKTSIKYLNYNIISF